MVNRNLKQIISSAIQNVVFPFYLLVCIIPIHAEKMSSAIKVSNIPKTLSEIPNYYITRGDTLKAKAAEFILANIKYHYAYSNSSCESLLNSIDSISSLYNYPKGIPHYQSLYEHHHISTDKILDSKALSIADVMDNIDSSFADWKEGKWAQHLSFEQFCEFLLPYRIKHEKYENWRNNFRNIFMEYASEDSVCSDKSDSPFWAARNVCEGLKKIGFHIDDKALPKSLMQLPPRILLNMHMGDCHNLAILTTYIMRSCGIPVACDFTPQWPNKANRHSWNALLNNTGQIIPFVGSDIYPGQYDLPGSRLSKVYRYTYEYQFGSAYDLCCKYNEPLPPSLDLPYIKDVSTDYFKGNEVIVNIKDMPIKRNVIFIAVFDNSTWIPIAAGKIDSLGNVKFKDLGRGIVYTPIVWTPSGSITCGTPFLLKENGDIKIFTPNKKSGRTIHLERKYPIFGRINDFAKEMQGGVIEASNSPNFDNAEKMAELNLRPHSWYNEISIKDSCKTYRYWRLVAPKEKKCDIAELEFIKNGNPVKITQYLCDDVKRNGSKAMLAFDNDRLTYYSSVHTRGIWLGIDFEEPKSISKVRFLPRNDDNHIVNGKIYQLAYFNERGEQIPLGTKVADDNSLCFENVPNGALLILHDLMGGREERIFSYSEDGIKWY